MKTPNHQYCKIFLVLLNKNDIEASKYYENTKYWIVHWTYTTPLPSWLRRSSVNRGLQFWGEVYTSYARIQALVRDAEHSLEYLKYIWIILDDIIIIRVKFGVYIVTCDTHTWYLSQETYAAHLTWNPNEYGFGIVEVKE